MGASTILGEGEAQPILPPADAFAHGWMPLTSTGVTALRQAHPTYDGRGVLIGILDSGIDPGIPGLSTTSTGDRKILDLRDFSGEGEVALERVIPQGDSVRLAGRALAGFSRVRTLNTAGPYFAGSIRELPLGEMPASDLNGDRDDTDTLMVVVTRATDGWVLFADTDGDGSLADERPVHDYLIGRETFSWFTRPRPPQITLAANFRADHGVPSLDLFFDTSAHGSHVAGIAAGHDLYGVPGFDGVAPGAQLIGLKIANNAQGGISTTGSMLRALDYAIAFAAQRHLPLVINMSFGVGNEQEGKARIDQLIDSVLAAHPGVVFTISAGNDGPGLSTLGFPGSADRAITVGATFPTAFLNGSSPGAVDPIAYFSSRGGELAKPDIVTPGLAYSTVPRWNTGDEQKGGTSMAAPHAAGLAALLASAIVQRGGTMEARQIRQALMVTARPIAGESFIDDGTGVPDINAAVQWLEAKHSVPEIWVHAVGHGASAAFRRTGFASPADTLQKFALQRPSGAKEEAFTLRSSAEWLRAPASVQLKGSETTVSVSYQSDRLRDPGVHTGVISGWSADTLAGPAFRLVNTVVVPATGPRIDLGSTMVAPGGQRRIFFEAEPDRPFMVTTTTASRSERVLAYLHEPGGQPYREASDGIQAGAGEDAGTFLIDGRDVVPGFYEAVAVAPPLQKAGTSILVEQSPVAIAARRDVTGLQISLRNFTDQSRTEKPFAVLVGAERGATVVSRGGEPQRIPFTIPDWAVHAVVDISMEPAQWSRFTDFGVTLFDSAGRQLGKSPLNYATGRLHIDLSQQHGTAASLMLSPGLADPNSVERWAAKVSIRLYVDSAKVVRLEGNPITVPANGTAGTTLQMQPPAVPLGDAFFPLGIVVLPDGERTWTREVGLPVPSAPLAP